MVLRRAQMTIVWTRLALMRPHVRLCTSFTSSHRCSARGPRWCYQALFRLELKAASEVRRAKDARQTANQNAAFWERLRTTPTRVLSPPRYAVEPPGEDEVAATLADVARARAAAARCRSSNSRFLTVDQKNTRRRFASHSKRTETQLAKATSVYTSTVGLRQAALYRQKSPLSVTASTSPPLSSAEQVAVE